MIGCMFSGYGGLSMAVAAVLDDEVAWHAEIEPAACRILARHWPDVPNLGDVSAVDWAAAPPVEVITAGFPCQDLSYAGKGAGIKEGTRSGLWSTVVAAVRGLGPRLVVLENVSAIVARRPGLDVVITDLATVGYDVRWTCLRAADVGAPHGRDRWFAVAHPHAGPEDGFTGRGGRVPVALLPTPAVNDMGRAYTPEEWDAWTAKMQAKHGNGNGHGKSLEIEAQRLLPTPTSVQERNATSGRKPDAKFNAGTTLNDLAYSGKLLPTPRASEQENRTTKRTPSQEAGKHGLYLSAEAISHWGDYADAIARWERILGRPAPEPTVPSPKTGKPRLSPVFVEWMMGLPEGHVADVPDVSRAQALKALGNGVVPQQAIAAVSSLLTLDMEAVA